LQEGVLSFQNAVPDDGIIGVAGQEQHFQTPRTISLLALSYACAGCFGVWVGCSRVDVTLTGAVYTSR
jgi:hypothetical protein